MRLIKCHIENFGKLSGVDYNFSDGLNIINEVNGSGKSTLAAFIRVMFYGFANEGKRNELENERRKYKPWQGGVYGGSIIFATGGKTYRMNRSFGAKDRDDEFLLIDTDTMLPSSDYSQELGEEIFKIDRESFCRTVYIAQGCCETKSTDSISAKIGNLAENTDDINNFEIANRKLSDKINSLSATRKTGALSRLKKEISELEEEVRRGTALDASQDNLNRLRNQERERLASLKNEQINLQGRIKELSSYKELKSRQEQYLDLQKKCIERENAYEASRAYFNGVIPETSDIDDAIEQADRLTEYKRSMEIYALDDHAMAECCELEELFSGKVPSESDIDNVKVMINRLNDLSAEISNNRLSAEDENKLMHLSGKYSGREVSTGEIDSFIDMWGERYDMVNKNRTNQAAISVLKGVAGYNQPSNRVDKDKNIKLVIFVIVLLGTVIFGIFEKYAACAVCVIGLIGMAAYGIIYRYSEDKKNGSKETDELLNMQNEITQNEQMIEDIDRRIKQFFSDYGMVYEETGVINRLIEMKSEITALQMLRDRKCTFDASDLRNTYNKLKEDIDTYISVYSSLKMIKPEMYGSWIGELEKKTHIYRQYLKAASEYSMAKEGYDRCADAVYGFIKSLSSDVSYDVRAQLQEIRDRKMNCEFSKAEYDRAVKEIKAFEAENDIAVLGEIRDFEDGDLSLDMLNDSLRNITDELGRVSQNISDYTLQLDRGSAEREVISDAEERLEKAGEEYNRLLRQLEVVKLTKEYLIRAKTSFTARYMQPVMSGFNKYYNILSEGNNDQYEINANMEISLEEAGMQRDIKTLSCGYQDMAGICMRMALVDAMYEEEKPFVIFDDPFVNLDSMKIMGGMNFLKEISKEYQIIYFTCHNSRV